MESALVESFSQMSTTFLARTINFSHCQNTGDQVCDVIDAASTASFWGLCNNTLTLLPPAAKHHPIRNTWWVRLIYTEQEHKRNIQYKPRTHNSIIKTYTIYWNKNRKRKCFFSFTFNSIDIIILKDNGGRSNIPVVEALM